MSTQNSIIIRQAKASDIPYLAAMHIQPARRSALRERTRRGGSWFNFYLDKMRLYYRLEPEGLWVAEDGNGLVGFCMASHDMNRLKYRALTNGVALSLIVNALRLRYGISPAFVIKALLLLVALVTTRAIRTVRDKESSSLFYYMHRAMICAWLIVAEKRGTGVGNSLLDAACDWLKARGATKVGVMTRQDNTSAIQMYLRNGFETKATRLESVGKVFYMVKDLGVPPHPRICAGGGEPGMGAQPAYSADSRRDVVVRPAVTLEIPCIAALHIDPPMRSKVAEIMRLGGGWYNFYVDKVRLYHKLEPKGLLVAVDSEGIAGFCITSRSAVHLKHRALTSGIAVGLVLNALHMRYGFTPGFLAKAALVFFSMYGVRAIRTSRADARAPLFYTLHETKIWAFVVATECRGRGVGQVLLEAACDYLRSGGCRKIGVMVKRDNPAAIKAYSRAGFKTVAQYLESVGKVFYMVRNL